MNNQRLIAEFLVRDREVNYSNPDVVNCFLHPLKIIKSTAPELYCLACRSRAILPTLVGLCLNFLKLLTFSKFNDLWWPTKVCSKCSCLLNDWGLNMSIFCAFLLEHSLTSQVTFTLSFIIFEWSLVLRSKACCYYKIGCSIGELSDSRSR